MREPVVNKHNDTKLQSNHHSGCCDYIMCIPSTLGNKLTMFQLPHFSCLTSVASKCYENIMVSGSNEMTRRNAAINQIHGFMLEFVIAYTKGRKTVLKLNEIIGQHEGELPASMIVELLNLVVFSAFELQGTSRMTRKVINIVLNMTYLLFKAVNSFLAIPKGLHLRLQKYFF